MKTRFRNMIISLGGGGFRKIGLLKLLFITFFVSFFCVVNDLFASSPGMIEGPPGCTWKALVLNATTRKATLKLIEEVGRCTYEGCQFTVGEKYVVSQPGGRKLKKNQSVNLWIEEDPANPKGKASLSIPPCKRSINH